MGRAEFYYLISIVWVENFYNPNNWIKFKKRLILIESNSYPNEKSFKTYPKEKN